MLFFSVVSGLVTAVVGPAEEDEELICCWLMER